MYLLRFIIIVICVMIFIVLFCKCCLGFLLVSIVFFGCGGVLWLFCYVGYWLDLGS